MRAKPKPGHRATATCPDCGAFLEWWDARGYRCPWATASHQRTGWVDGIIALTCNWPLGERRDEFTAPIGGRIGTR